MLVAGGAVAALVLLAGSLSFFGGGDSGDGDTENPVAQKEFRAEGEAETFQPPAASEGQQPWLNDPIVQQAGTLHPPARPKGPVKLLDPADFPPVPEPQKNLSAEELFAGVSPAVVAITAKDDLGRPLGSGSGFFVPAELPGAALESARALSSVVDRARKAHELGYRYGIVLTNYHVIKAAADCDVKLADGREGSVLDVVTEDEKADLAILQIHVGSADSFASLALDEGPEPTVGQTVYAIGNPEGLTNTLSEGIISGRREMVGGVSWLQTTAPISPGSSGGPLLTPNGKVIGVVTASRVEGQNLNFAVPVSAIQRLLAGPCKTREIWRGASILREESCAYNVKLAVWVSMGSEGGVQDKGGEEARRGAVAPLQKAKKYLDEGKYEDAIRSLTDVGPSFPEKWSYLLSYTLGKAHGKLLLQRSPQGRSKAYVFRDFVRNSPDFKSATQALKRSIELNPEFSPAYDQLCFCHRVADEWPEALLAAESLVRLVPRCYDAYSTRAMCFRGLWVQGVGSERAGLLDLLTAVELNPKDADAYFQLGVIYENLGEYRKQIKAYEDAIERGFAGLWACYFNMGQAHRAAGEYQKAIDAYRKATAAGSPYSYEKEIGECTARLRQ